ncbi:MAG: alpha/beta hydrolase [Chloroflexi bacterium]|nr:alpha/beta hydrolase [Chloroflexota bacterium]
MNIKPQKRSLLRRIGRWLGWIGLLIVGLLIGGWAFQRWASQRDRQRFLPAEQQIMLNGHAIRLICMGSGSPTIVLEAGLGDGADVWGLVQPALAEQYRVCAYDRVGMGWSEAVADKADRASIAQTLHELLSQANVSAPYVLVGHSAGGLYVREYAQRYPEQVAGLVLVDSSHEQQRQRQPQLAEDPFAIMRQSMQACDVLAPFGIIRLTKLFEQSQSTYAKLSQPAQASITASQYQTSTCSAMDEALAAITQDLNQAQAPQSLNDLPLVVLTRGIADSTMPVEFEQTWDSLQQELAQLSSNSQHQIAETSGHYIHLDQPELVIAAVEWVISQQAK